MTTTRTGSKRLLRDLNQSIVLNLIAEHGALSRADLVRKSGLPAATITRITSAFLSARLITEEVAEEASAGRRPVLLRINPTSGYVVGVNVSAYEVCVVVCELHCTILHSCKRTLQQPSSPASVVAAITQTVKGCLAEAGVAIERVLGVGIGLAGIVDYTTGTSVYSPTFHWGTVSLGPVLESQLGLPVRLDNDINTLAIAQRQFGIGRTIPHFLLLSIGAGMGAGIVIGGEIYRGARGGAGEIGHTTVDLSPDAPLCQCGKRGCLEAFVANYGLLAAARAAGYAIPLDVFPDSYIHELIKQAHDGDHTLQAIFARAGTILGVAIANLFNTFDPTRIFLEQLSAEELMVEPMYEALRQHTFGPLPDDIVVLFQAINDIDCARGAASIILREVFQAPIFDKQEGIAIDDLLAQAHPQAHSRR